MRQLLKGERITFRLTAKLKQSCESAAERDGLTLLEWIRFVLARAANEGAYAPPKRRRAKDGRKTTT